MKEQNKTFIAFCYFTYREKNVTKAYLKAGWQAKEEEENQIKKKEKLRKDEMKFF